MSTAIACIYTHRKCICIEKDETHLDVYKRQVWRWVLSPHNEEQDVKKKIMMVVGACIFLIEMCIRDSPERHHGWRETLIPFL